MEVKNHMVPQLRFPVFTGNWETSDLSAVFRIGAGGDIDKERLSPVRTEEFQYPVFANAETEKGFYGYASYYKEEGGCVTVSGRGNLGTPHARHERFVPIVRLLVLRPRFKSDIDFFEKAISRIPFFIESTGVPQLTGPQISGYNISFPSLPEQQKIAAFLTAVDERIGQLSEKKALLEAYKKGVMQQLFSRELRFQDDDGNDFPEWEEKKLGEVSKFINGRAYKQNELLSEGPYPVLRVGNFFTNPEWYYSDLELPADKYCDTGDLLYAWSASFGPRIWRGGKVIFHYHIWKVIPSGKVTKPFLFHLLDWDVERIKNAQGNGIAMMHVTKQAMEERPVSLPCVEEQTKIAAFLTALDRKIEAVSAQIDLTRIFKKGLLQQMFV